ncbi:PQQ-binding-like beta-propeller repeat protein [Oerskovia sp. NPDC060338]|uniref:outer membrane protein assembly factor BamB family protein n=1 Tax=Oerskovia sp. NPDC060338 TaxID=3347100 RepID=UPI003654041B
MVPRRREHSAHAVELVEVDELDDDFDAAWGRSPGGPSATGGGRGAPSPPGSGTGRTGGPGRARRRGREGDDAPGTVVLSGAPPPDGEARPSRARRVPVRALVVAAVAVAVAGTGASLVVGGLSDRHQAVLVATQPGGLWSVRPDPDVVWRASTDGGWPAAVEGQVVLEADGDLQGLDVATGEPLWSASLPRGTSACGPDLLDPGSVGSPLVCVTEVDPALGGEPVGSVDGPTDPAEPATSRPAFVVTVLDPAGQVVGARALAGTTAAAAPLAGGLVATARRDGDRAVVSWEEALDGTLVRTRVLKAAGYPVDAVGSTGQDDAGTIELHGLRGLLHVRAPDLRETFDASGEYATGYARPRSVPGGWAAGGPLPGDLRVRAAIDPRSGRVEEVHVLEADGGERYVLPGEPFVPAVTDGTVPHVLVVRSPGFTGYDTLSGRRLWHREEWPETIWLQTDDVLVVESGSRLIAIETRTGRDLWRRWLPSEVHRAFTDGDSLLLTSTISDRADDPDEGASELVSLNLFDGGLEWRDVLDPTYREVVSAQGQLFAVTDTEVVRIG